MNCSGLYEPISTTEPIPPNNLLKFVSYNYVGDGSTRQFSSKNNTVKCISACGICQGNQCKIVEIKVTTTSKGWTYHSDLWFILFSLSSISDDWLILYSNHSPFSINSVYSVKPVILNSNCNWLLLA